MRFILALVFAFAILLLAFLGLAFLLDGESTQLHYRVYVDADNRIFINGEPGSEGRVYDLARDMTIQFDIEYDPRATLAFCFQDRGCPE